MASPTSKCTSGNVGANFLRSFHPPEHKSPSAPATHVRLSSFYQPLKAFYGVGNRSSLRGIHSARRIYSGENSYDGYDGNSKCRQADNGGGGGVDQDKPETWGVLQMLRNSTLRGLFINFCEQSLCGESVDFLVDVAIHYESLTDPEEQFSSLSGIVETYLAEGSANEVNVSNAYRNAAGAWLTTKKDEFFALEGEQRAHVLDRQRDEIAKVRVGFLVQEGLLLRGGLVYIVHPVCSFRILPFFTYL